MLATVVRAVRIPLLVAAVVAAMFFGVKARYGDYGDYYYVAAEVPRAGQLLRIGSDVRESGVVIGTVTDIQLVDGGTVELTLQIRRQYRVPSNAEAFIDLKTLLGDKYVDLRFEEWSEPFLEDGDRIVGHTGLELEDALQSGVQVFDAIDPEGLATIVTELAQGTRGHGEDIRRGLSAGAALSTVFRQTLAPQLRSLRDFDVIFGELEKAAGQLNQLADAVNQGVPVYASEEAQAQFDRALVAVRFLANNLGDLLIVPREDWDTMMDAGDTVLQTIVERTHGLHNLVQGLYRYVFKLGGHPPVYQDGSAAAPFSNFTGGEDFEGTLEQLCGALPPDLQDIPACGG